MRRFLELRSIRAALACLALGLFAFSAAAWASPVEPPLHLLFSGKNRLIAGTVKEINPPDRLVFARSEVFGGHDDVPELIDVIVSPDAVRSAALGGHYVFAYTTIHRDKRFPGRIALNKQGAVLISSTGVEPALFPDTRPLRRVLSAADSAEKRDSAALLRLLLKTLKGKDAKLQYLAAAQIALDSDLGNRLSKRDQAVLRKVASDARAPATTRYTLLHAALMHPERYGRWHIPVAGELLASTPLDGYPQGSGDPTELILLAFDIAQLPEAEVPEPAIARWQASQQPLFRELATRVLEARYPGKERD